MPGCYFTTHEHRNTETQNMYVQVKLNRESVKKQGKGKGLYKII